LASLENALDKLYYFRMERAVGGTLSVGGGCCSSMSEERSISKNLITLFRMNKAGVDAAIIQENLIPEASCMTSLAVWLASPFGSFSVVWRVIHSGLRYPISQRQISMRLAELRARLKAYLIRYAWLSQTIIHYPSACARYMVSKETEVSNIRKIVRGKESRTSC